MYVHIHTYPHLRYLESKDEWSLFSLDWHTYIHISNTHIYKRLTHLKSQRHTYAHIPNASNLCIFYMYVHALTDTHVCTCTHIHTSQKPRVQGRVASPFAWQHKTSRGKFYIPSPDCHGGVGSDRDRRVSARVIGI